MPWVGGEGVSERGNLAISNISDLPGGNSSTYFLSPSPHDGNFNRECDSKDLPQVTNCFSPDYSLQGPITAMPWRVNTDLSIWIK